MKNPTMTLDLLDKRLYDLTAFPCVVDQAMAEPEGAVLQ